MPLRQEDKARMEALVATAPVEARAAIADALKASDLVSSEIAELQNLDGRALLALGDGMGAASAFTESSLTDPTFYKPLANLGHLRLGEGAFAEAVELYSRALQLEPGAAKVLSARGEALHRTGQLADARRALEAALAIDSNHAITIVRLSRVLVDVGEGETALALLRSERGRHPTSALLAAELGFRLHAADRFEEATADLREAIRLDPSDLASAATLGDSLRNHGELSAARSVLEEIVRRDPTLGKPHLSLAHLEAAMGNWASYRTHLRLAAERGVTPSTAHATGHSIGDESLFYMVHEPGQTASSIRLAHEEWARTLSGPMLEPRSMRAPGRPLRVAYSSPDFRLHVVTTFFEGVLEAHDRERLSLFLISSTDRPDQVTQRLAQRADLIDVSRDSDDELGRRLLALDLDVLVDLGGHTRGSRLSVLRERVATVTMTYLGYPTTTGLSSVDYRITDASTDPDGAEAEFTEKLIRLPRPAWSYRPLVEVPPSAAKAEPTPLVFGCFNRLIKMSEPIVSAWREILERSPDARLLVKVKEFADPGVRAQFLARFPAHLAARIDLEPWTTRLEDAYRAYARVDVALDTYPYNGTTTTCDALYMGVPVVTWHGETSASRVGRTLLGAVGLAEYAAMDGSDYVSRALALSADRPLRHRLRSELRGRLRDSPLGDPLSLARALEDAFEWSVRRTK